MADRSGVSTSLGELAGGQLIRDYQDAARRTVEILGEPAARELLVLLDSDDVVRADAFRQFHNGVATSRCSTL